LFAAVLAAGAEVHAIVVNSPMHWSGDKTIWDRKANVVQLFGHASVHQSGDSLTADYISLDLNSRMMHAKGNCLYFSSDSVIQGEEMHFNVDNKTGVIVNGRVTNESFTLTGERINKLSSSRYQTHRGSYTTCYDCPGSWKLGATDVDLEIDGYAHMKGVTTKVKDAPLFWFPYLIIPIKTKRQTGFLFPKFEFNSYGFNYLQPFFWATGRSTDMTMALGHFGGRGTRFEWEGRYQLEGRGAATANFFFLNDATFHQSFPTYKGMEGVDHRKRWAFSLYQQHDFPLGIEQKLKINAVSDSFYPTSFPDDLKDGGEGVLKNDLILSRNSPHVSAYVAGRYFRNLIPVNVYNTPARYDPDIVQILPTAAVTTTDKPLFGSLLGAGLTLGATNFTRQGPTFDRDPIFPVGDNSAPFRRGRDPIRKALRASVVPSLYTTLRPFDVLSVVPSAEYRAFFYRFPDNINSLARGYMLFKTDLSFQLERVYGTRSKDVPMLKHLFRPTVTYNLIPFFDQPKHPFLDQIKYANDMGVESGGYNFDSYDLVPLDDPIKSTTVYYMPLGHSLSYGFVTQLIRRRGNSNVLMPDYQRSVDLRAWQTFNLRELRPGTRRQPFSKLYARLGVGFDQWNFNSDYSYTPYVPANDQHRRHTISNSLTMILERTTNQGLFAFDRSFSVSHVYNTLISGETSDLNASITFSISDYIMPSAYGSYQLIRKKRGDIGAAVVFQSPARCWKFDISYKYYPCILPGNRESYCHLVNPNFTMNLTGNSYGGVAGASSQVIKK